MQKMIVTNPKVCTGCRYVNRCVHLFMTENVIQRDPNTDHSLGDPGVDIPVTCLQCEEAPCQEACPTHAIRRNLETRAMETREELCIQCHMCALACPFGATLIAPEGKSCDVTSAGDPECVKLCEKKAIQYLPVTQLAPNRMRQAVKDYFPDLQEDSFI